MPFLLQNTRRVVVKLGTGILRASDGKTDATRMAVIASQVARLREMGLEVVLVSSGAVGLGMGKLGLEKRPKDLPTLQACAAIGQAILMDSWQKHFVDHGITVAQILLTNDDVRVRDRHLNIQLTMERLLSLGIVPIVNENDTVSTQEIKFGDNDLLSALVASLLKAEILVILSTIPGLMNLAGDGAVISVVPEITPEIEALAGGTQSATAVGGMRSKLTAAKVAIRSACGVYIASGYDPEILLKIFSGETTGTFFLPRKLPLASRKRWIAFFERPMGSISIDAGAQRALSENGASLLPRGIVGVLGSFSKGQVVTICSPEGRVIGRGIAQFSKDELQSIQGLPSAEIKSRYPSRRHFEAVHRDSLVLL
jgi:glutamate 5-kinase